MKIPPPPTTLRNSIEATELLCIMSYLGAVINLTTGQDEASAPAPVQYPASSASPHPEDASLNQTCSSASAGQDTTTPAPVLQQERQGGQECLEGRRSTAPAEQESDAAQRPAKKEPQFLPLLHTTCWLTFFSIFGTLTRLGLSGLTTYPGAPLGGVIWANFAGCVVMGFLVEDLRLFTLRPPWAQSSPRSKDETTLATKLKSTFPLYVGLTTGFCGSVTSFSSFLLVVFENLSNTLPAYEGRPTKGYNLLAALGYLIATLSLSFSGLQLGAQLAIFAQPVLPSFSSRVSTVLDWCSLPLAVGAWIGAVLMCVYIPAWRGEALYACVFSPLGVYIRFLAGRWWNPLVKTFPVGTFVVNVVGTAVLAGVMVGRYRGGGEGCKVVKGVGDGFCGCLTTVSTFVVEVKGLRVRHAYVYAGVSIVVGMCLMILVLGTYTWTHDVNTAKC